MIATDVEILGCLVRIEAKLDTLIAALADDDAEPQFTLDGERVPGDRAEGTEL